MDGDLIEPTDAMIAAGADELALALPADTDPGYTRNLARIIWRAMTEAADA